MIKKGLIILIIIALIVFAGCKKSDPVKDNFAKCLTEKGMKFYGAYWCPHCAREKQLFGDSFQYIMYIECSLPDRSQTKFCNDVQIKKYPTFEFGDGSRVNGEQSLEELGNKTGCTL